MVSLLNFETLRPLDVDALKFRTKIPVVFLLSLIVPVCHGVRGLFQDFLLLCTSSTLLPSTQTPLAASYLAPTESWTPGSDPKAIYALTLYVIPTFLLLPTEKNVGNRNDLALCQGRHSK